MSISKIPSLNMALRARAERIVSEFEEADANRARLINDIYVALLSAKQEGRAQAKEPIIIEQESKEVEYWKKATGLAMEIAGVTTIAIDHARLHTSRWLVRRARRAHECRDVITIDHEVDASTSEPKYIFLFEGTQLTNAHFHRFDQIIRRWSRSSFTSAIVIELPMGCKLHIKEKRDGTIADIDPDKIGVKIVQRPDIDEAQVREAKRTHQDG